MLKRQQIIIAALTGILLISGVAGADMGYFYQSDWDMNPYRLEQLLGPPTYAAADENSGTEMWYTADIAGYPGIMTYFFTAKGEMTEISFLLEPKIETPRNLPL